MNPVPCAIGLGSNVASAIGGRRATIAEAIARLGKTAGVQVLRTSTLIETAPVGLDGGPGSGGAYYNGVTVIETTLPPRELLDCLLEIERSLGRDRTKEGRYGARTIDLDLLLYGDQRIDLPGLIVPHPRMRERAFVMIPLREVWPDA